MKPQHGKIPFKLVLEERQLFSPYFESTKQRPLSKYKLYVSLLLFVETIFYQKETNLFSTHKVDVVFDEKFLPLVATVDDVQLYKIVSSLFDQHFINMLFLKTIKSLQNSATVRHAIKQICLVGFELVLTVDLYTHTEQ